MKVTIDESLQGKELFKFLVENKSQLITQKKSMLKRTDVVCVSPSLFNVKGNEVFKSAVGTIEPDASSIRVKVVANTSLFCDSQMDVLLRDSASKSIKERKGLIPHLHDHIHEIGAEVGDVADIYYQDVSLIELGYNKQGIAQALVFETDIKKSYNPVVFEKYRTGKIKQHSIGLQYINIGMAINDQDYVAENELWNKYAPMVINQDVINEKGYFFVVPEYKLLENSSVLFGSNSLTPTLEANAKTDTPIEPPESTQNEPLQRSEAFDIEQLLKNFQTH